MRHLPCSLICILGTSCVMGERLIPSIIFSVSICVFLNKLRVLWVKTMWVGSLAQVNTCELRLRCSGFFPQLCHWVAVWLWVSQLYFLCHPFSICKMNQTQTKHSKKWRRLSSLQNKPREDLTICFSLLFPCILSDLLWQVSPKVFHSVAFLLYLHHHGWWLGNSLPCPQIVTHTM